jgi:hypothetical protein
MLHRLKAEASGHDSSRDGGSSRCRSPLKRAKGKGAAPFRYLATQPFVAILGDPDHREMDRKRRLGALARVTHTPKCTENLLKPRPKGGGFAP